MQELKFYQHQTESCLQRSGSGEERNPLRSGRQDPDFPRCTEKQREGEQWATSATLTQRLIASQSYSFVVYYFVSSALMEAQVFEVARIYWTYLLELFLNGFVI